MGNLKDSVAEATAHLKSLKSKIKTRGKLLFGKAMIELDNSFDKKIAVFKFMDSLMDGTKYKYPHEQKDGMETEINLSMNVKVRAKKGDKKMTDAGAFKVKLIANKANLQQVRKINTLDNLPEGVDNILFNEDKTVKEALNNVFKALAALAKANRDSKQTWLKRNPSEEISTAAMAWNNGKLSPEQLETELEAVNQEIKELTA